MSEQPAFLYIEDHPASRQVFRIIMSSLLDYHNVTVLDSSEDILEQLHTLNMSYDIIFLDLNMRPLSGYDLCKLLRENDLYQNARIIGLTANTTPAIIRKMQTHGFDGVIGKPISHDTFAEQINQILSGEDIWET